MKTGTAIALTVGVIGVTGLVIWGITANRIIDIADRGGGGGTGGGGGSCANLKLSSAQIARTNSRMPGLIANAGIGPNSPAFDLMQLAFMDLAPQCSWSTTTVATISDGSGHSFSWQTLVDLTRGKTLQQAANDPQFNAWLSTITAPMGSPGSPGPLRSMVYELLTGYA